MAAIQELPRRAFSLVAALVFFMVSAPAWAQTQMSTLRGTITDASGALAPGVTVTAEEILTGVKVRTVTTDSQGNFEMPDVKAGTYRVRASASGFKTFVANDVLLESNQTKRVDIQLQVGDTTTEVTVTGAAPVIETEDAKLASEFTGQQYKFVPLPGNAYSSPLPVLATMPNVQFQAGCQWCLSVAGQTANQMGMDGVKEENTNTQTVNMENAEEVKVVAVNNSAEFSRAAYYNVVTKRGTNAWHGEASYYHRNSALAARSFFEDTKPQTLYHTFNLSASGPIIKDKTFFYALWNGERVPEHTFHLNDVPTAAMRGGNFSQLLGGDSGVTLMDPTTGAPFAGNIIPTSRLSSVAQKVQDGYIPAPNRGGPDALASNFEWVFPYPGDQYRADVLVTRIDHQLTSKNSLFGRLSVYLPRYVLSGNYPALLWTRLRQSHSWVISDTHVVTPSLVNTFTFGGNRDRMEDGTKVDGHLPTHGDTVVKEIGLEGVNPQNFSTMGFPSMYISGYSPLVQQNGGVGLLDRNFTFADSVSWSKGRHVFKFGFEHRMFNRFNGAAPEGTYGNFSFDGRFTGNAYADFLLGYPATSTRLDPLINRRQLSHETGLFVTDTFKVTSKLNLDIGLRWDYFGSPHYEDGLQYNFDPTTGDVIVPQAAIAKVSPLYDPRIKVIAGDPYAKPDKKLIVPRLGGAYRLSNKTALRAGWGMFTEAPGSPFQWSSSQGGGPFQIQETYNNRLENGAPLFSFPNPFPAGLASADVPSQGVSAFPQDIRYGRTQQYNVTLEHQVKDIGLRISYIGSRSSDLNYLLEINKPEPSLIPFTDSRRPWPQLNSVTMDRDNGEARYNSMTLEASRRIGNLNFDAHWTWGHNMNNMGNTLGSGGIENPYAPLYWNRDFQAKHRFVLNWNYDLPFGRGRKFLAGAPRVVDEVLGGWKLYWVTFLQGGQYFSPYFSGSDPSNTNTYGGLPDRLGNGNLPPDQRSINGWFDGAAFAVPGCTTSNPVCTVAPGRFGNSGVNILEGPGLQSHSATLAKRFSLTERLHFDFMAMVSNLFNHPNFYGPGWTGNNDITVPGQVGVISGQHDLFSAERSGPRLIELRGRLEF